jgi:isoleucyl-tRNA synthetase
VAEERGLTQGGPADLYLEGSDQHRGWFQSSLLTSVASRGMAPYKTVLTHGFVLDEKGYKMSKSVGNVVDPRLVIQGGKDLKKDPAYGADVLRLWVASVDYTNDVCIGDGIIKQTFDAYKKLRGTIRYLLGNIADYNPATDAVPYADLPEVDRYCLAKLDELEKEVSDAYSSFQFYRVVQALSSFNSAFLSTFYLDMAKDRLYIRDTNAFARRSCQTTLDLVLTRLLKMLAPVLPHMAEDAFQSLPYPTDVDSVFMSGWGGECLPCDVFVTLTLLSVPTVCRCLP